MCLAIPGKIISVDGQEALVDFSGVQKKANVSLVDIKKGDWVIIHAGFAIEKIDEQDAFDVLKIYAEGEKK